MENMVTDSCQPSLRSQPCWSLYYLILSASFLRFLWCVIPAYVPIYLLIVCLPPTDCKQLQGRDGGHLSLATELFTGGGVECSEVTKEGLWNGMCSQSLSHTCAPKTFEKGHKSKSSFVLRL